MTKTATGGCLCGAVRFTATYDKIGVGLCHCGMCRRWTGAPMFGVHLDGAITFDTDDTLTWYKSSDWAERGFCATCGTSLFYRLTVGDGMVVPASGAFDDQTIFSGLRREIFTDEKPAYYNFAGDHDCLTGAEFMAWMSSGHAAEGQGE
jgi:hypothetical protein